MTVKISSPNVNSVEANSNLSMAADPLYEDLMDWAKARKRQFLRNRVQQSSEPIKAAPAESETPSASDAWIETWYTPPPLPSRLAKQKAIASYALHQEIGGKIETEEVQETKPLTSPSPTASSFPNHDSFEIGQQVVLCPDSQRVPSGIPIAAVLVIQEMYINVYRQHQNIWCVWCSSDAFSGLKSIDYEMSTIKSCRRQLFFPYLKHRKVIDIWMSIIGYEMLINTRKILQMTHQSIES